MRFCLCEFLKPAVSGNFSSPTGRFVGSMTAILYTHIAINPQGIRNEICKNYSFTFRSCNSLCPSLCIRMHLSGIEAKLIFSNFPQILIEEMGSICSVFYTMHLSCFQTKIYNKINIQRFLVHFSNERISILFKSGTGEQFHESYLYLATNLAM